MRWYLRARRLPWLAGANVVCALVILLVGDVRLPWGDSGVFIALLLPGAMAGIALAVVGEAATAHERTSVRPLALLDCLMVALVAVLPALVLGAVALGPVLADQAGSARLELDACRNLLGYLGIALAAWAFVPRTVAPAVPFFTAVLLTRLLAGRRDSAAMWPVAQEPSATSFLSAGVCLAAGALCAGWAIWRRSGRLRR